MRLSPPRTNTLPPLLLPCLVRLLLKGAWFGRAAAWPAGISRANEAGGAGGGALPPAPPLLSRSPCSRFLCLQRVIIYPNYLDSRKTVAMGRRVPKELGEQQQASAATLPTAAVAAEPAGQATPPAALPRLLAARLQCVSFCCCMRGAPCH